MMTPLQRWVGHVWSEVLGVSQPRTTDNFIELGGHSLHAVRTIFTLRGSLGIDLPLSVLFDTASLEEFCDEVEQRLAETDRRPDVEALLAEAHPVHAAPAAVER